MLIEVDRSGSVAALTALFNQMSDDSQVKSILVLACDDNGYTPETLDPILAKLSKPVFGGIFPEIIAGHEKLSTGCIVAGLHHDASVQVIPGLSDSRVDYESLIDDTQQQSDPRTLFICVDGFGERIGTLIYDLFNVYGLEFNYIGGGAGSLSFERKPCVFTPEGLLEDAAVLAMLALDSGVGVSHGWSDVAGPFKVTESEGNVIKTLDWKPAFRLYREVVEAHASQQFTDDNFF
ncbi:FIST N-terminal domain-containing protein [Planctomycetota bacterium]